MTGHIYIYGEIGKQVTLDTVLKEITSKATDYVVHIHSPGGDVFEGYAIHNAIKNTGKEIEVRIEGTCASIAMSIASTASPGKLFANTKSNLMVHNPTFQNISGSSKDLRNAAGLLEQIKSQFLKEWQARTGLDQSKLSQMYDNETWLTPEQALELGFIDGVREIMKAVASADLKKFNHMQDKKTLIGKIEAAINNFFSPKNATDTLADGTVVNVPEEGDWVGKQVTLEDGTPLPPGEHQLASGKVIVIDDSGNVAEVREMEAKKEEEPTNDEDMKLKAELQTANAKIKELESALEARNAAATKAEAKAKTFETKLNVDMKALQEELNKIKTTTVGDDAPIDKGVKNTLAAKTEETVQDPMQKFFGQIIIDPRK